MVVAHRGHGAFLSVLRRDDTWVSHATSSISKLCPLTYLGFQQRQFMSIPRLLYALCSQTDGALNPVAAALLSWQVTTKQRDVCSSSPCPDRVKAAELATLRPSDGRENALTLTKTELLRYEKGNTRPDGQLLMFWISCFHIEGGSCRDTALVVLMSWWGYAVYCVMIL